MTRRGLRFALLVGLLVAAFGAGPASAQEHKLTVTTNAGGSVTGGSIYNQDSIDCGPNSSGDCEDFYPPTIIDQTVHLTATPLDGWAFDSWSGSCASATTNECNVTFFTSTNRTAGATFRDVRPPTVELTAPAEGTILTGDVTLSATASDVDGIREVAFYIAGDNPVVDTTVPYETVWHSSGRHDRPV